MIRLLVGAIVFLSALSAKAINVEDAYKAIPHRQATFDPAKSTLAGEERAFLQKLFTLSDQALVARIESMTAFREKKNGVLTAHERRMNTLVSEIEALRAPSSASGLQALLIGAIRAQTEYFREWEKAGAGPQYRQSANALKASSLLQQLYGELMGRYAQESAYNKDSFFQHLCALDFI